MSNRGAQRSTSSDNGAPFVCARGASAFGGDLAQVKLEIIQTRREAKKSAP
jgi:hypothetical protein